MSSGGLIIDPRGAMRNLQDVNVTLSEERRIRPAAGRVGQAQE